MENMIKKIVDADNEAKAMEKDTLEEKEELSMSTNPENTQDVIIKILQQAMECSPGKKEDYGEER